MGIPMNIPANDDNRLSRALLIMAEAQTRLADAAIRSYDAIGQLVVTIDKYVKLSMQHSTAAHERMIVIENNEAQLQQHMGNLIKLLSSQHASGASAQKLDSERISEVYKSLKVIHESMALILRRLPPEPPPPPPEPSIVDKLMDVDPTTVSLRTYNLVCNKIGPNSTARQILDADFSDYPGVGRVSFSELVRGLILVGVERGAVANSRLWAGAPDGWKSDSLCNLIAGLEVFGDVARSEASS